MTLTEESKYAIGANRNLGKLKESKDPFDADVEHVEHVEDDGGRAGKTKRAQALIKKHWRRFWCCYLVGSIVFLAIFLPIFFLIIIPAIAQLIVDKTNLPVYSAEILDPKPDRVSFSLKTSLSIPAGIKVHIDPVNLTLFIRDEKPIEPYLMVPLHGYDLSDTTNISVTRNDTKILDKPDFIQVLTHAVYQRRFTMSAKGSTVGHLGALDAPLTLNKDVELNGLDKLRGFSIESARLLIPAEDDGTNLLGSANLPNHSVFTLALGNVTLDLKSEDLALGQATIYNVVLKPGDNFVNLRGYIDIDTILDNIPKIMAAQTDALSKGNLELSADGNSTIYNGEHIRYYEEILNNLTLTAQVPIMKVLMDTVQGLANDSDIGQAIAQVRDNLEDMGLGDMSKAAGLIG